MDKKKVKEKLDKIQRTLDSLRGYNDRINKLVLVLYDCIESAQKELSKPDWISVEDRLPEYNERVLVRYKYGKETYTIISYRMKDERIRKYNNGFIHPIDGFPITHWKPIEKLEE